MKKILILICLVGCLGFLSYLGYISYLKTPSQKPILSPNARESLPSKRVIGFLPYWQVASTEGLRFSLLDEVIYFGLHITQEGEIATRDSDGNRDQGYARFAATLGALTRAVKGRQTTFSVAIILQDNEKIETFLQNQNAQENLIENVSALLTQNTELSGINLDFEYSGIPGRETIDGYTSFVTDFVNALKIHNPSLTVSVDITADAIRKTRLYNVESLAKAVDYVILMGYDFYRPASSVAGPVAPLRGKEIYEYDITTAVADFLTVVPKEKLLLGVPYYGWDFPTENEAKGSFVEKRPNEAVALSSYKRNRRLIEESNPTLNFDEESQTPWMVYRDPDTNGVRQVWFENEVSLEKKYNLVNKESLAGIAIWALGYDGNHEELWDVLRDKFQK